MADQITNYQCPACTGPMHFVGSSGRLECDYCGSSYSVEEIEALYAEKEKKAEEAFQKSEETPDAMESWGVEEGMKAYSCPSCGAELICDETTAATSCPYCGNPTVVPGQFSGMKRPKYIIPFKLSKEEAVAALKKHYQGKILLPRAFTNENHIQEIKGVYVPFWLFDAKLHASVDFQGRNVRTHREGDYRITETDHYDIRRAGNVEFGKIPVDGSTKMPDDHMDSIEPFDYTEMKDFSTAYLPGFLADKYDVTAEEASERAEQRCENSAIQCLKDSIKHYDSLDLVGHAAKIESQESHYAMLPVWMLTTQYQGEKHIFAMNGQTGRLVGDLPVDKGKAAAWLWGLTVGLGALLSVFLAGPIGRAILNLFH